jgi:DNA-binding beta-propeller fold protein YncE
MSAWAARNKMTAMVTASFVTILVGTVFPPAAAVEPNTPRGVNGTIWVANRGAHTIREFDAATGEPGATVPMTPGSRPGDLAHARGKLYVAEESAGTVAVVDATSGQVRSRIPTGPRPHHMDASAVVDGTMAGGPGPVPCRYATNLVAYALFGTNKVGVIDARTDVKLGEWFAHPNTALRSHAAAFGPAAGGLASHSVMLYVASELPGNAAGNVLSALDAWTGQLAWALNVPHAHELVVTSDGQTAYVSARSGNAVHVVDLDPEYPHIVRTIAFPAGSTPDTLQLTSSERLLTVGLRSSPAQVAFVDTTTFAIETTTIAAGDTIAGHQWTSPDGHYTFAAFEDRANGPNGGVAVVDHRQDDAIVQSLPFAGMPHGVAFVSNAHRQDDRGDACGQA